MNLKGKVREGLENNQITTIWITDMDGTLINTATPDWGRDYWKGETGFDFPAKTSEENIDFKKKKITGWWGRIESMDPEVFPNDVIPQMQGEYNKVKNDPSVLKVVMTGRMEKRFGDLVPKMLTSKGLDFDVYALNTGGETSNVKVKQMTKLLEGYPNAKKMFLFEDREAHFPKFEAFGEEVKKNGIDFELIKVVAPEGRF